MNAALPARDVLRAAISAHAEAQAATAAAARVLERAEDLARDAAARAETLAERVAAHRREAALELAQGSGPRLVLAPSAELRELRDEAAAAAEDHLAAQAARDVLLTRHAEATEAERGAAAVKAAARCRVEAEAVAVVVAEVRAAEARAAELRRLLCSAGTARTISEPPLDMSAVWVEPPENVDVRWGSAKTNDQWRAFRVALAADADAVLEVV